jgi:RHS repeat-associated protein
LFMKIGTEYYIYQNDHLGTPQKMTAVNGAVVWSAKYNSFGEANVEVESVENNLRFPGQYADVETGLHYNYHRYYDPKVGKYLRTDPSHSIQPEGTAGIPYILPFLLDTPQEFNLYPYVQNNPVNEVDSRGLFGPFGPGLKNIGRSPCEIEFDPYQECLKDAAKARKLCTRLLWAAQAKGTAICALGCIGSTVGYPACFASCSLAFHKGFSIARAGCWAAYLGMVENCRRTHGK